MLILEWDNIKSKQFKLPLDLLQSLEEYYGYDLSDIRYFVVDNLLSAYGILAYASGNIICVDENVCYLDHFFAVWVIGHEIVHIIQQFSLGQRSYEADRDTEGIIWEYDRLLADGELEKEADYYGLRAAIYYFVSKPVKKKEKSQEAIRRRICRPYHAVPVQAWSVGGTGSEFRQSTLMKLTEEQGFLVSVEGVHEALTRHAVAKTLECLKLEDRKLLYRQLLENTTRRDLIIGSKFNDVCFFGNIMFAALYGVNKFNVVYMYQDKYIELMKRADKERRRWNPLYAGPNMVEYFFHVDMVESARSMLWRLCLNNAGIYPYHPGDSGNDAVVLEFIYHTHGGNMQFLHTMDTSFGDLEYNKLKTIRWARFCIDIYRKQVYKGKCLPEWNLAEYVLYTWEQEDLLAHMLMGLLLRIQDYWDFENRLSRDTAYRSLKNSRAKSLYRIDKMYRTYFTGEYTEYLSFYGKLTVREFFSKDIADDSEGKKNKDSYQADHVAAGTVLHMIQDSFTQSHSKRPYNLYYGGGPTKLGQCGAEALSKKLTPIMLFADYTEQDSDRHTHSDLLIYDTGFEEKFKMCIDGGEEPKEDRSIQNTSGAVLAYECAAQFLYMLMTDASADAICEFLGCVFRTIERSGDRSGLEKGDSCYYLTDISHLYFHETELPTGGGRLYETEFDAGQLRLVREDRKLVQKNIRAYQKHVLQHASNKIYDNPADYLLLLKEDIFLLREIMLTVKSTVLQQHYIKHLFEINIELQCMKQQFFQVRAPADACSAASRAGFGQPGSTLYFAEIDFVKAAKECDSLIINVVGDINKQYGTDYAVTILKSVTRSW